MKIQSIRGMNDIGEKEIPLWHHIEQKVRTLCENFNYFEVRTPALESTALFKRGVGDNTDIVEKEMYSFEDRNGDHLSLRPEGTAAVVRAVIEHNWLGESPILKMYYLGAMFRHERPQKGRYRQFHQYGVELIGVENPEADVEVMALQHSIFQSLGLTGVELQVSSVGCETCRPSYKENLVRLLTPQKEKLCEDCQRRLETNPLRILDCKNPQCKVIATTLPKMMDQLCEPCNTHFNGVRDGLVALDIPFKLNPLIVRGLDYYVRTAFEFINTDGSLGAQGTVGGGGRYDKLFEQLDGKPTPAVGFAAGIERLCLLLEAKKESLQPKLDVFVVVPDEAGKKKALQICHFLRIHNLKVDIDLQMKSMKSQMKRADKSGAKFVVIIGSGEIEKKVVQLKDMAAHSQEEILLADIENEILKRF